MSSGKKTADRLFISLCELRCTKHSALCTMRGGHIVANRLNPMGNASGTNVATLLGVRDQRTSPKETLMSQSDKKDTANPPMKAPSSNPSSPTTTPSPSAKPGMKDDDHKTGSDKPAVKADDHKSSSDSKR